MTQPRLNFQNPITTGKKNQRLSVAVSEEFLEFLDRLAVRQNMSREELAYRYILQGMQAGIGELFMAELTELAAYFAGTYAEKALGDLIGK
jgi:hypothetical protein